MTTLFITGISGLLGLNTALAARGRFHVAGCYRTHAVGLPGVEAWAADAADGAALAAILDRVHPDIVLHTAGLSNVDLCEEDPALAVRVNVEAAETVARLTRARGARLIHISTDHLFDGATPSRREDEPLSPVNVYGRTKADAEAAVLRAHPQALVVRTNFYGWGTSVRTSFSDWILDGLERGESLTMFDDVHFTPVLVNDLAAALFALAERGVSGIVNVPGGERLSKDAFARTMARVFGVSAAGIRSASVGTARLKARRPRDMSLSCARVEALLGRHMPSAAEGLETLRTLRDAGWTKQLQDAVDAGKR